MSRDNIILADLLKELYIAKSKVQAGDSLNSAFAEMSLPLADIGDADNPERTTTQTTSPSMDVFEFMSRSAVENKPQEVYPVEDDFYAKITDGSITRTEYVLDDGKYYDWTEMETGGTSSLTVTEGGRTGSSNNILVDINKTDSIPNDSKVRILAFSHNGGILYYYFSWEGWGTKATPYEIHTDPTTDDNKTWDAESPPADKDGKTTKYSNVDVDDDTPDEITLSVCTWEETVDSEGHVQIVGDETKQSVTWSTATAGCPLTVDSPAEVFLELSGMRFGWAPLNGNHTLELSPVPMYAFYQLIIPGPPRFVIELDCDPPPISHWHLQINGFGVAQGGNIPEAPTPEGTYELYLFGGRMDETGVVTL